MREPTTHHRHRTGSSFGVLVDAIAEVASAILPSHPAQMGGEDFLDR